MNEKKDTVPPQDTVLQRKCVNCEHYNVEYPPPFCLDCRTGLNDDYRKPDFFRANTAAMRIEKAAKLGEVAK